MRDTPIFPPSASQSFDSTPSPHLQQGEQRPPPPQYFPANVAQRYFPGPTDQTYPQHPQQQPHQRSLSQSQPLQQQRQPLQPPNLTNSYQRLKEQFPLSPAAEKTFREYLRELQRQGQTISVAQCVAIREQLRNQTYAQRESMDWAVSASGTKSRLEGRPQEQFGPEKQTMPVPSVRDARRTMGDFPLQQRLSYLTQDDTAQERTQTMGLGVVQQGLDTPSTTPQMLDYYGTQNVRARQQSQQLSSIPLVQSSRSSSQQAQQSVSAQTAQRPLSAHISYPQQSPPLSTQPARPSSQPTSQPAFQSSQGGQGVVQPAFRLEMPENLSTSDINAQLRHSASPRLMTATTTGRPDSQIRDLAQGRFKSVPLSNRQPLPAQAMQSDTAAPPREPSPEETLPNLLPNRPEYNQVTQPSSIAPSTSQSQQSQQQLHQQSQTTLNLLSLFPRLLRLLGPHAPVQILLSLLTRSPNLTILLAHLVSHRFITPSQVPFLQAQLTKPSDDEPNVPPHVRDNALIVGILHRYVLETRRPELAATINDIVLGSGADAIPEVMAELKSRGLFSDRDFEAVQQRINNVMAQLRAKGVRNEGGIDLVSKSVGHTSSTIHPVAAANPPLRTVFKVHGIAKQQSEPSKPHTSLSTVAPTMSLVPSQRKAVIAYAMEEKDLSAQIASWPVDQIARNVLLAAGRAVPFETGPRLNESLECLTTTWRQLKRADLKTLQWDVIDPPKSGARQYTSATTPTATPNPVVAEPEPASINLPVTVETEAKDVEITTLGTEVTKPPTPELAMSETDVSVPVNGNKKGRPRKHERTNVQANGGTSAVPVEISSDGTNTPASIASSKSSTSKAKKPKNPPQRLQATAPSSIKDIDTQDPFLPPYFVPPRNTSPGLAAVSNAESLAKSSSASTSKVIQFRKSSEIDAFSAATPYLGQPFPLVQSTDPAPIPVTSTLTTDIAPISPTPAMSPPTITPSDPASSVGLGKSMFRRTVTHTTIPGPKPPVETTTPIKPVALDFGEYTPPTRKTVPQVVIISPAKRMTPRAAIVSEDDGVVDVTPSKPSTASKRSSQRPTTKSKSSLSTRKSSRPTAQRTIPRSTPRKGVIDLTATTTAMATAIPLEATSSSEDESPSPTAAIAEDEKSVAINHSYPCRWRNCHADLHSFETLQQHVLKVHGKPDPKTKVPSPLLLTDMDSLMIVICMFMGRLSYFRKGHCERIS